MAWTSDQLIANVRVRARIPDGASVVSDAELLVIADEVIADTILPLVRKVAQEYGVVQADQSIVADQDAYRIPTRAQVQGLRDVILVQANSGVGYSLPQIPLEERETYQPAGSYYWRSGSAFCLQGDKVILLPTPTQSGFTLRLRYYRRPSRLVLDAAAAQITDASNSPGFTVDAVPAAWSTDDLFDTIEGNPGFDWLATDSTATDASGTSMDFAATPSAEIANGDYFALAGETPIPQIPAELHSSLALGMTVRIHELMGRTQLHDRGQAKLEDQLEKLMVLLTPRVDGENVRIIPRGGLLRGRRRWRR